MLGAAVRGFVRRSGAVMTVVLAVAVLGACRAPGDPGQPTAAPTTPPGPTSSPTSSPAPSPTDAPTSDPVPTGGPTTDPTDPTLPGSSDGVRLRVTVEPGYTMPLLVESSLKQARQTLDREGASVVRVVDARAGTAVAGQSNGWTVCSTDPAAGTFTRESAEVVLTAAPNARQCR